jgi:hypothetical protein
MVRITRRLRKQLVAAAAVGALAMPATSSATVAEQYLGFATPARVQQDQQSHTDLRSPDAKDATRAFQSPPRPEIARAPGFDWGDAGIGAGSVLGLMLILLSVVLAVVHRRSPAAEGRKGPAVTS